MLEDIGCRKEKYNKGRVYRFKKNKTQKGGKVIQFKDYPEFTPNLTPREIFKLGSCEKELTLTENVTIKIKLKIIE